MACNDSENINELKISNFIIQLVRKEIQNYIEEIEAKVGSYVKREELSDAINQCVHEKLPLCLTSLTSNKAPNTFAISNHGELEVKVEFGDNDSLNSQEQQLSEACSILEQRISTLESKTTVPCQMLNFTEKFKTENEKLEQELSIENRLAAGGDVNSDVVAKGTDKKALAKLPTDINPYDDLYYEWRQNKMNLLHCKKSEDTLQLNQILERETNPVATVDSNLFVKFIKSQDILD